MAKVKKVTPTIEIAGQEIELRLTMRRVELLEEHTGLDLLNANGELVATTLKSSRGITGAIYALAGGESKINMTREDFADEIEMGELAELAKKIEAVFARDAGSGDSGNVETGPKDDASE